MREFIGRAIVFLVLAAIMVAVLTGQTNVWLGG